MNNRKKKNTPETQHTKISDENGTILNHYNVLDNPDDRITQETGDGTTIVVNDNPDDAETKEV